MKNEKLVKLTIPEEKKKEKVYKIFKNCIEQKKLFDLEFKDNYKFFVATINDLFLKRKINFEEQDLLITNMNDYAEMIIDALVNLVDAKDI